MAPEAMSVRCWAPASRTPLTSAYAASLASDRVGPVPVQQSTRPPDETSSPSTRRVPECITPGRSAPTIGAPVLGVPGYPADATTTVTAGPGRPPPRGG